MWMTLAVAAVVAVAALADAAALTTTTTGAAFPPRMPFLPPLDSEKYAASAVAADGRGDEMQAVIHLDRASRSIA